MGVEAITAAQLIEVPGLDRDRRRRREAIAGDSLEELLPLGELGDEIAVVDRAALAADDQAIAAGMSRGIHANVDLRCAMRCFEAARIAGLFRPGAEAGKREKQGEQTS